MLPNSFFLKKIVSVVSCEYFFSLASETVEGHNKKRTFFTLRAPPGLRVHRYCLFFLVFPHGIDFYVIVRGAIVLTVCFFFARGDTVLTKKQFSNYSSRASASVEADHTLVIT